MSSNYTPGQVLTAADLNASFDAKTDNSAAAITGGTVEGLTSLQVTGTTDSTSVTTGAVIVSGGVGIALDVQVGGGVTVAGEVIINDTAASISTTTGALVVTGGVGIGGNVNIGSSVDVAGSLTVTQPIEAASTTAATSTTTGAMVVIGGVGVGGALYVGGAVNVAGTLTQSGALDVTNATASTSTTTGALIVTGGVGIGGAVNAATASVTSTTASTSTTTGAATVAGGLGVVGAVNVGGALAAASIQNTPIGSTTKSTGAFTTLTANGATTLTSGTASTTTTTGALVVTGGVGVSGAINAGGALSAASIQNTPIGSTTASTVAATTLTASGATTLTSATASTTSANGALVVTGGVGVGGAVNVGGALAAASIQNTPIGSTTASTVAATTLTASGIVTANSTTSTTSPSNGALVVAGGVGVAGALWAAGLIGGKGNPNLQTNGSGELGANGWTLGSFSALSDTTGGIGSYFGNSGALSTYTASASGPSVKMGASVAASMAIDVNTSGVSAGTVSVSFEAFNSSNAFISNISSQAITNGTGETRYYLNGTTPAGTAYVYCYINCTSVTASALGLLWKRVKIEKGSFSTLYSQEATIASGSGLTAASPVISSGPLTFSDGSMQASAAAGKNKIINGAFTIDQWSSGASRTIVSGTALAYVIDRFYAYCTGSNVSGQQVAGSGSMQNVYQFSGGAGGVTGIGFGQRIEKINSYDLNGTTATLSVSLANTLLTSVTWTAYYANTADSFGTLASPTKTQIATGTFTVNSTLSRYSAQIAIPSAATTGIEIVLSVGAQNSGTWTIGNLQLESGSVATPFERRPYPQELALCQRYYELFAAFTSQATGYGNAGNVLPIASPFKVTKRIPPVIVNLGTQSTSNCTVAPGTNIDAMTTSVTITSTGPWYWQCSIGVFNAEM